MMRFTASGIQIHHNKKSDTGRDKSSPVSGFRLWTCDFPK